MYILSIDIAFLFKFSIVRPKAVYIPAVYNERGRGVCMGDSKVPIENTAFQLRGGISVHVHAQSSTGGGVSVSGHNEPQNNK